MKNKILVWFIVVILLISNLQAVQESNSQHNEVEQFKETKTLSFNELPEIKNQQTRTFKDDKFEFILNPDSTVTIKTREDGSSIIELVGSGTITIKDNPSLNNIKNAELRVGENNEIEYASFTALNKQLYKFIYENNEIEITANSGSKVTFDPKSKQNKLSGDNINEIKYKDSSIKPSLGLTEINFDEETKEIREIKLPPNSVYTDNKNNLVYSSKSQFNIYLDGRNIKDSKEDAVSISGSSISAKGKVKIENKDFKITYEGKDNEVYTEYNPEFQAFDIKFGDALLSNGLHNIFIKDGNIGLDLGDKDASGESFSFSYSKDGKEENTYKTSIDETLGQLEVITFKEGKESLVVVETLPGFEQNLASELFTTARLSEELGDYQEALKTYIQISQLYQDDPNSVEYKSALSNYLRLINNEFTPITDLSKLKRVDGATYVIDPKTGEIVLKPAEIKIKSNVGLVGESILLSVPYGLGLINQGFDSLAKKIGENIPADIGINIEGLNKELRLGLTEREISDIQEAIDKDNKNEALNKIKNYQEKHKTLFLIDKEFKRIATAQLAAQPANQELDAKVFSILSKELKNRRNTGGEYESSEKQEQFERLQEDLKTVYQTYSPSEAATITGFKEPEIEALRIVLGEEGLNDYLSYVTAKNIIKSPKFSNLRDITKLFKPNEFNLGYVNYIDNNMRNLVEEITSLKVDENNKDEAFQYAANLIALRNKLKSEFQSETLKGNALEELTPEETSFLLQYVKSESDKIVNSVRDFKFKRAQGNLFRLNEDNIPRFEDIVLVNRLNDDSSLSKYEYETLSQIKSQEKLKDYLEAKGFYGKWVNVRASDFLPGFVTSATEEVAKFAGIGLGLTGVSRLSTAAYLRYLAKEQKVLQIIEKAGEVNGARISEEGVKVLTFKTKEELLSFLNSEVVGKSGGNFRFVKQGKGDLSQALKNGYAVLTKDGVNFIAKVDGIGAPIISSTSNLLSKQLRSQVGGTTFEQTQAQLSKLIKEGLKSTPSVKLSQRPPTYLITDSKGKVISNLVLPSQGSEWRVAVVTNNIHPKGELTGSIEVDPSLSDDRTTVLKSYKTPKEEKVFVSGANYFEDLGFLDINEARQDLVDEGEKLKELLGDIFSDPSITNLKTEFGFNSAEDLSPEEIDSLLEQISGTPTKPSKPGSTLFRLKKKYEKRLDRLRSETKQMLIDWKIDPLDYNINKVLNEVSVTEAIEIIEHAKDPEFISLKSSVMPLGPRAPLRYHTHPVGGGYDFDLLGPEMNDLISMRVYGDSQGKRIPQAEFDIKFQEEKPKLLNRLLNRLKEAEQEALNELPNIKNVENIHELTMAVILRKDKETIDRSLKGLLEGLLDPEPQNKQAVNSLLNQIGIDLPVEMTTESRSKKFLSEISRKRSSILDLQREKLHLKKGLQVRIDRIRAIEKALRETTNIESAVEQFMLEGHPPGIYQPSVEDAFSLLNGKDWKRLGNNLVKAEIILNPSGNGRTVLIEIKDDPNLLLFIDVGNTRFESRIPIEGITYWALRGN